MFGRDRSRNEVRRTTQNGNPLEPPAVARARHGRRMTIAWSLTGVWVVGFVVGVLLKLGDVPAMSLNEWGDFFAGAAAPLALLWLVIGYFQHGEELRLSTQALYAQQLELRQQAIETRQLVKTARDDLTYRQTREARQAEPLFVFAGGQIADDRVDMEIANEGAEVRAVKFQCNDYPSVNALRRTDRMKTDDRIRLRIIPPKSQALRYPLPFRITCSDLLGNWHNREFELLDDGSHMKPISPITPGA